jgi:hypothetical protein
MNEQFSHRRYIDGDHPQVPRRREVRLLDEGEILRCAQDDNRLSS